MAHRATCSTPTERGRTSSRESTSTRGRSAAGPTGETPACTSWAVLRWASFSTAGQQAPSSRDRWGARMRSTRAHSAGQPPRGRATWRPRLSRVRWRTLEPQRTERTRRWVKWGSWPLARGRVGVRRTNRLRWEQALGRESGNCKLLWHCIGGFRRLAIANQRLAAQNTPNSARIAPRLANLGQEAVVELFDARQDMPALIGKVA